MFVFPEKKSFGLDISDRAVRLIQTKKNGKKFSILSHNELPLPKGVIESGEIKNIPLLSETTKKLINTAKGKKIQCNHVISVLPETKTIIKLIKIFCENMELLPQAILQEMTRHIPYAMDEIYFDWQIVGKFKPQRENNILFCAAPIGIVNSYIEAIKGANLIPLALEIEAAAIVRGIFPLEESAEDAGGSIIVDLGANRTSLIACEKGIIHFTMSLPISGEDITQKISEKLKIDYKKAEEAKILCGLDEKKCSGALKKILYSSIDNLIDKIGEAIMFYKSISAGNSIQKIILSGGGAQLMGLDKILTEKFSLPVDYGNPLVNIYKIEKSAALPKKKLQSFTTSIGLSLRGSH